jgi:hypothetical protein
MIMLMWAGYGWREVIFVLCCWQCGCISQNLQNVVAVILYGPAILCLSTYLKITFGKIHKGVFLSCFLIVVCDINKETKGPGM